MLGSLRADHHQVVDEPTHALTWAEQNVRNGISTLGPNANDDAIISAPPDLPTRDFDNVAVVHGNAVKGRTTRRQRSRPLAMDGTLTRAPSCSRWIGHGATLFAAPVGTTGGARPGSSARSSSTLLAKTSRNCATRCVSWSDGRTPQTT